MLALHRFSVNDVNRLSIVYAECYTKGIALNSVSNCTKPKQQCYLAEDIIAVYEDNTHYASATRKKTLVNIQGSEAIGNKPIAEQKAWWNNAIAIEKV